MFEELDNIGVDTEASAPKVEYHAIENGAQVCFEVIGYNIMRQVWVQKKGDNAGKEMREIQVSFRCQPVAGQELRDVYGNEFLEDNSDGRFPKSMFVKFSLSKDRAGYINKFYQALGIDLETQLKGYKYFADIPKTSEAWGDGSKGVVKGVTDPLFDEIVNNKQQFCCIVKKIRIHDADTKLENGEIEDYQQYENQVKEFILPE